jgi:hypothetical protein
MEKIGFFTEVNNKYIKYHDLEKYIGSNEDAIIPSRVINECNILDSTNSKIKLDYDFRLRHILKIKTYITNDYVYDFSIPKFEKFYANNVLVHNTDSCYLVDPFHDKERLLKVKDEIINYIKSSVPFPVDTFDMKIDDEIEHMFFFKGVAGDKTTDTEMNEFDFINKGLGLMKKNYLYITKSGKVKFKNLGVKKKSTSLLTRKIFNDYIIEKIKTEHKVKFSKAYYLNLIQELLDKDMLLASMRKEVGPYSQYEKTSPTGLSAQISKKYGAGIHFLIPNLANIGIGKGKSYCTEEEFKKHKLTFDHIDFSNVWAELEYFTESVKTKSIFDFEDEDNSEQSLSNAITDIIKKEEEKPIKRVSGTLEGF